VREWADAGGRNLTQVCRQLGYSKQAYYKSLQKRRLKSSKFAIVRDKVLAVRSELPRLGGRKLHYLLQEDLKRGCLSLGRDRLFDLLRQEGLLVRRRRRYTKTTDSRGWMRQYPDRVKGLKATRPEQVWVADITYLQVGDGFCYLHLITDAYSKKIMGYHLSKSLAATATTEALRQALQQRRYPELPLIHHSDRGLQYSSALYTSLLKQHGIEISMTQDGSPYDNAIAERVNGILKDEFGLDGILPDELTTVKMVRQSIMLYNEKRPHLSNHYLTPEQMHKQSVLTPKAWHKKACLPSKEGPQAFSTFAAVT
ncbi:MAG: IS3 family transposase, partial [Sphingobacteriales bacterium]